MNMYIYMSKVIYIGIIALIVKTLHACQHQCEFESGVFVI